MHLNSPCHASHIICPQKHGGIGKCRSKQGDNSPAQQQIAVAVMKGEMIWDQLYRTGERRPGSKFGYDCQPQPPAGFQDPPGHPPHHQ